jgi:hypothetical protein
MALKFSWGFSEPLLTAGQKKTLTEALFDGFFPVSFFPSSLILTAMIFM